MGINRTKVHFVIEQVQMGNMDNVSVEQVYIFDRIFQIYFMRTQESYSLYCLFLHTSCYCVAYITRRSLKARMYIYVRTYPIMNSMCRGIVMFFLHCV